MRLRGAAGILLISLAVPVIVSCQDDKVIVPHAAAPTYVSFLQSDLVVSEPDGFGSDMKIPVIRSAATGDLEAGIRTRLATADSGDVRIPSHLTFAAGEETSFVHVELFPDTLAEGEETFSLILVSLPPDCRSWPVSEVTVRIRDRLAPSGQTVSFLQPEIRVPEGAHEGPYPGIRIPVVRSDTTGRVTVPITGIPRSPGYDCFPILFWQSDAVFESGKDTAFVGLGPCADASEEGNEELELGFGALPAGYSPGWWPRVRVQIEDLPVHHDPAPNGWPLKSGNSWTYQVSWSYEDFNASYFALGTCSVRGEVRYRGRAYQALRIELGQHDMLVRKDFFFTAQGDSLLFVPASDTGYLPVTLRSQLPWLLAVFSDSASVSHMYYDSNPGSQLGVKVSGYQREQAAIASPVGAWENVVAVSYRLHNWEGSFHDFSEGWTFYLAAGVGPIQVSCSNESFTKDGHRGHYAANLIDYTVQP